MSPKVRDKLRHAALTCGVLAFVCLAGWKLYSLHLKPQLERAQVKHRKQAIFDGLTQQGAVALKCEDFGHEVFILFDPDQSDELLSPHDPVFRQRKYWYKLIVWRPLTPEEQPHESEQIFSASGHFPEAGDKDPGAVPTYYELSGEHAPIIIDYDARLEGLKISGSLAEPWGRGTLSLEPTAILLSPAEMAERFSKRADAVDATAKERVRRQRERYLAWMRKLTETAQITGELTVTFFNGEDLAEPMKVPIRAAISGTAPNLSMTLSEAALAGNLIEAPGELTFKFGSIVNGIGTEASVTSLDEDTGTFQGRALAREEKNGMSVKTIESTFSFRPMTKAEVVEEERQKEAARQEELRKKREEEERIEREKQEALALKRKWIYLLCRRGGLRLELFTSRTKSWIFNFECLELPTPLAQIRNIEDWKIKYAVSFTDKNGLLHSQIVEGGIEEEDDGLHVILNNRSGGVNEVFSRMTINLDSLRLDEKTISGRWEGRIPPGSDEKNWGALAGLFILAATGEMVDTMPDAEDFSGAAILSAVSSSPDDYLLGTRAPVSSPPSVAPASASAAPLGDYALSGLAIVDDPDGTTNLRHQPTSSSRLVKAIPTGELVKVTDETEDGWLRVRTSSGEFGYVHANRMKARDEKIHARIRLFMANHHAKAQQLDVEGIVEDYAEKVQYLGNAGLVGKDVIRSQVSVYFKDTARLVENIVGEPRSRQLRYGVYLVQYQLSMDRTTHSGKSQNKLIDMEFEVRTRPAGIEITKQKAKVQP